MYKLFWFFLVYGFLSAVNLQGITYKVFDPQFSYLNAQFFFPTSINDSGFIAGRMRLNYAINEGQFIYINGSITILPKLPSYEGASGIVIHRGEAGGGISIINIISPLMLITDEVEISQKNRSFS